MPRPRAVDNLVSTLQLPDAVDEDRYPGNFSPIRVTGKPTSMVDDESKLFKVLIKKSGEFLARHVLDRGSIM